MSCGRLIEIIDWKFSGEAFGRVFSFRGAYAPLIFFLHIPLTKTSPSEEKKAPLWRKKSAPRKSVSAHKFTSAPQKRYRDTVWWVLLLVEYALMNLAAEPRHLQGLQYREPPPTQNQEARAANSVRKTWGGERWRREQRLTATAEKLHRCFNLNMAIDPQSHSKYWWKLLLRIWWLSGTIMAGAAEPGLLN